MKNKIIVTITSIMSIASMALAFPVSAQTSLGVSASVNATAKVSGSSPSTTVNIKNIRNSKNLAARQASQAQWMQNGQDRGTTEIQNRINALNKLLARIQGMRNLSDSQKASFTSTIQTTVASMTSLEAKIKTDTTATSLKTDLQTIVPDYRIYMLAMPQVSILSAVDRVNTLVTSLQTIQSKIQTRVSGNASLSGNTTISSALSDMTVKLSNASVQASAAQAEVINLAPDKGDKTIMQSNTTALKDARLKIKTAIEDLQAARKDAESAIKLIVRTKNTSASSSSVSNPASTASTTTTTQ